MVEFLNFLHREPLMLLFLSLGLGTLLGRVKLGIITLGSTTSTLLVGLLISAAIYYVTKQRFKLPDELDTVFLQLFTFSIGLKVGPQFFSGLKREGFHLIALGLITSTINFLFVVGMAKLLKLPSGFAPGIMSGSYTITAIIGVASGAVDSGTFHPPSGMTPEQVKANIAAAYAIVYIFSTVFIILMIRYLPKFFGIDPVAAGKKTEAAFGQSEGKALPGTNAEFQLGYVPTDIRVYKFKNPQMDGISVKELVKKYDTAVLKVIRDGKLLPLSGDLKLTMNDEVSIFGTIAKELPEAHVIGDEVDDSKARNIQMSAAEIVVLKPHAIHKTLQELHESAKDYGLYLKALFRHAHEMPLLPKTELKKGDVLRVYGSTHSIETAGEKIGSVLRPSLVTDMATLAFGICIGFLMGAFSITIGGIPFGLGTSGGVILAGILVGTFRTYYPAFGGPVTDGARSLMQSIGLDLFIGVLALNVAPDLIDALKAGREVLIILGIGIVAALLPPFISWLVGLYIFKMDPIILAGAVAGSRNATPAMNAIQQESQSTAPAIGFPVPYALTSMLMLIYGYLATLIT